MSRRRFLAQATKTIGTLPVLATLPGMLLSDAIAAQVAPDDPRVRTERLSIQEKWGKLDCYLARPSGDVGALPGIIVAHDKLGLTPHFEDMARRFALEGFVAIAPDYASRFGGTPSEPGPALEIVGMTTSPDMTTDTQTAMLQLNEIGAKKLGAVGYGLGGTAVGYAAARLPDLMAVTLYYGHPTPLADIGRLKAPLLINLAGKDQFVDPEIPGFVEAMKKTGVKFELYTYEGTVRGFDDDSAPTNYSADAARLAWSRTLTFLKSALV
ncbi:dienelactone hydrolase family protein [Nordella sp. HKS 07]|nr:dienelactone hydrolase family protein [Nordella sp. HKS 07]